MASFATVLPIHYDITACERHSVYEINSVQSWRHLITLSALASTLGVIVRPICFAVFRLMTNSNFVGCSTGRSAGFAPLRILSTYVAARRKTSRSLVE